MASAQALRSASSASTRASPAALSRRRQEQQTRIRSQASSPTSIPTSTLAAAAAAAAPKPILILFDLDNAPLPSQKTPEIASAVVSVLARKMEDLLLRGGGGGHGGSPPPSSSPARFPVRAAAFANEATVRSRPGLSRSLSSAGVSLVTVPSTKNAADAMVVSCAAGALSSSVGGDWGGGAGLSGVVFCSADNYFSEFLRYASHKGVLTFVAGDFDNGKKRRGKGGGSVGDGSGSGRRGTRSGEKKKKRSSSGESTATGSSSSSDDDDDEMSNEGDLAAPWRRKELPAAADGAALWSDVLSEARELLLLNH